MPWGTLTRDLSQLADVLRCFNETRCTSDSLKRLEGMMSASWRVEKKIETDSEGIKIPPPRNKALHPVGCEVEEATVRFRFQLGTVFEAVDLPEISEFQVRVTGCLQTGESLVALEDHWRIDSHTFPAEEDVNEPHPYFHFQRGGHSQDEFTSAEEFVPGPKLAGSNGGYWRGLMQNPGPRIATPPYCPVLALDFVISQHDGPCWRKMRSNWEYAKIVRAAQHRLWDPFFKALENPAFRRRWLGSVFVE